jgi:uncharacterized protein YbgA (DUF1722 family)/uncharacterized protein YbbK (DUF523 family)
METISREKISIGISSCLIGERVRFDSGHKNNSYITGTLSDYFEFTPFCPEVSIGLSIPREPIRLVGIEGETRCVGTRNAERDFTDELSQCAQDQHHWHSNLRGYILKKDSPSCGMERVKLYSQAAQSAPGRDGVGIYAKRLMDNFPNLPVEEEGRLGDARLRENFIQRVFIYSRWRELMEASPELKHIQQFHARHKYIFMSHDQEKGRALGAMLADKKGCDLDKLCQDYLGQMTVILKIIPSRKNHVNALQHIQGYLKNQLDKDDKEEMTHAIKNYHRGLLPLIVPITLLRHHFRRNPNDYISQSFYLKPHPSELMLLNNV